MKKDFFDILFELMKNDPSIYFIAAGLGWPRLDEFIQAYPDRTINTEAAEQTALDTAVGLAYSGKVPVVYTISPFFLRGWETIRTYINHEKLHVILIGAGVNDDYSKDDGFSHDATDIQDHFKLMGNMSVVAPSDKNDLEKSLRRAVVVKEPTFINIKR